MSVAEAGTSLLVTVSKLRAKMGTGMKNITRYYHARVTPNQSPHVGLECAARLKIFVFVFGKCTAI
jgi:hypothetical protein